MSLRILVATSNPDFLPLGKSTCVMSPVTIAFDPYPILVKNIFICSLVVFCASSNIIYALSKVLPLIYANGATSINPLSLNFSKFS